MGFFDRFTGKKPSPAPAAAATPAPATEPASAPAAVAVKPRLASAREKLDAKDLPGALAIYEEVLAEAGDRADVLVTISGDLGTHGHVAQIIELVAPRYDAQRHGPATGLNLLQAYLAVRDADAAQHVLDILFSLQRPELEERLYGFSNALAEMLVAGNETRPATGQSGDGPKVGLVTVSKPIWLYGLEALAEQILPAQAGKPRRIGFAQLATPGLKDSREALNQPENELGRLARGLPLWFAETFHFSAHYAPVAALGIFTPPGEATRCMVFASEWSTENLRQFVESTDGLDYVVTGALTASAGDYELLLRVFEVRGFRERKKLVARWSPATADTELANIHAELRRFMEWTVAGSGLTYATPPKPRAWVDLLGASAGLFLAEKKILEPRWLLPVEPDLAAAARLATENESAALAFLTLRSRAHAIGAAVGELPALPETPLVQKAAIALA